MTALKTVENDANVETYLNLVENQRRREDTKRVVRMMQEVTGENPRMWGDSIVGFGRYTYHRSDGSRHKWMLTGAAPRKTSLTVYIMPGFKNYSDLMAKLGKYKHSISCLYITKLDNIDFTVLTELVRRSVMDMKQLYGSADD